jgi:ubiquitin carboxyl-terminal hydrolase 4/11/15
LKEKSGVNSLINSFGIEKDSKVPTDLRSSKTGLENIGNTCFLNAAMQCIVGIDKLSLYFFKN